jgi:ParB-like chromosome segregation protein Spo0J
MPRNKPQTENQSQIKLSALKVNPKNPRLIRDERFEKLKKSITEFPKMLELRPIIVDDDNMILGGNQRYKALLD